MSSNRASIIEALRNSAASPHVSLPGSETYNATVSSYWSNQEKEVRPTCVIQPTSVSALEIAISILAQRQASFAVRGGGHQTWPGSANAEGGVVVDLSRFDEIFMDTEGDEVKVGAGVRWGPLYDYLKKRGLTVAGGRVAAPSVVGLALGGGLSYFSAKTGFVCDSVTSFNIVLYTGRFVSASPRAHPKLFQALKGGTNNFGIVTSITMTTFPDTDIWGGCLAYDYSHVDEVLTEFSRILASSTGEQGSSEKSFDENVHMIASAGYVQQWDAKGAGASLKYTAPVQSKPRVYEGFGEIPRRSNAESEIRLAPLQEHMLEEARYTGGDMRRLFITTTFQNDVSTLHQSKSIWEKSTPNLKNVKSLVSSIFYNAVHPYALRASNARGPNALGLAHYLDTSNRALIIATVSMFWEKKEDDRLVVESARDTIREIEYVAKEQDLYHGYKFVNYMWKGQDVMQGQDAETLALLKQVRQEYDPQGTAAARVQGTWSFDDEEEPVKKPSFAASSLGRLCGGRLCGKADVQD
ncbi:MAG: hypothetical protein Q9162_004389 [Coniocarpon cinnabarinum]